MQVQFFISSELKSLSLIVDPFFSQATAAYNDGMPPCQCCHWAQCRNSFKNFKFISLFLIVDPLFFMYAYAIKFRSFITKQGLNFYCAYCYINAFTRLLHLIMIVQQIWESLRSPKWQRCKILHTIMKSHKNMRKLLAICPDWICLHLAFYYTYHSYKFSQKIFIFQLIDLEI